MRTHDGAITDGDSWPNIRTVTDIDVVTDDRLLYRWWAGARWQAWADAVELRGSGEVVADVEQRPGQVESWAGAKPTGRMIPTADLHLFTD
jgi:hypothetical protein